MKSYRVEIIPRSAWGGPLQADTLFGHLCWALVYTEGENALRDFLRLFETPEPPLVLSSGFLKGYLPRPLLPSVTMALERRDFEVVKQLKRVTLLDEEWLLATRQGLSENKVQDVLLENRNVGKEDPWHGELTYHNIIDRQTDSVLTEGGFFQSLDYHLPDDARLNVYVKTDFFSETALEKLFDVVAQGGFGRDKSAGMGAFRFELFNFAFPPLPNANGFVSLSNFVPTPDDPTEGYYDLMTKFGKLGGDFAVGSIHSGGGHNPFKKPLIMLRCGSVFRDTPVREWYGGLISGVHTNPDIRHYGICYPLEVRL